MKRVTDIPKITIRHARRSLSLALLALTLAGQARHALAQDPSKSPTEAAPTTTETLRRLISERNWTLAVPAASPTTSNQTSQATPASTEQEQKPVVTFRIETDLVTFDVVATDKNGNYVRDLRAEDFEILDEGTSRKIDLFTLNQASTLSRPLAIVFALDLSGSLKAEEAVILRESAMRFTEIMRGQSVFAALTFNNEIKILQGFTDDPLRIEKAFQKINKFGGSTRIYDGLDRAITMLQRNAPTIRKGRQVRRVIVVITDGFDSASIIDRRELLRRAQAASVTVYSVTLPSYMFSATRSVDRVMTPLDATRVVSGTGGRDFVANLNDFSPIFKALAEEIHASYALAFYPSARDGQFHRVQIKTQRTDLQLRTSRTGYQAPTQ